MITTTTYKTEDGRTFTDKQKALDHEQFLKSKTEEQIKLKEELDTIHTQLEKALNKTIDSYTEYLKIVDDYTAKYKAYYKKYPEEKPSKDNITSFLDEFLSLFNFD